MIRRLGDMARGPKKISDFDVALGGVVRSKRVKRKLSQAAVAEAVGIPLSNYQRREDGSVEITTSELYRIATIVNVPAANLVEEALDDYGGMDKLLNEHADTSGPSNVTQMNVRGSRDIDLTTVPLHNTPLAASTDNTPIDPTRGEG